MIYKLFSIIAVLVKNKTCQIRTYSVSPDIKLGTNVVIQKDVEIKSKVTIGCGSKLSKGVFIGSSVTIGDYCSINRSSIIDFGVKKGNFCSIGPNCLIGAGKHALNYISTSQRIYGMNNLLNIQTNFIPFDSPPEIGHDVWIGNNVTIMQGIHIGNGSVVGSGAVVTKDIPPYAIVAGVPAKVLRYRFDRNTVEMLISKNYFENYIANINEIRNLLYIENEE